MTHQDAVVFLKTVSQRLPTAREFARLAMAFGAKGIVEIKNYHGERDAQGHYYPLIEARNPDGSLDEFYFCNEGYVMPYTFLYDYTFWTASHPNGAPGVYVFNGKIGGIGEDRWTGTQLVIPIKGL